MYDESIAGAYHSLRAGESTQRENSARLAKSYAHWTTKGTGEFMVPTVFRFDVTFVQKPIFTYGAELIYPDDPVPGKYPRTHAGVYEWLRGNPPGNVDGDNDDDPNDDLMYYTGAWVYFVVDIIGGGLTYKPPQPSYGICHHMAFEGIAIKDLPAHLLDF